MKAFHSCRPLIAATIMSGLIACGSATSGGGITGSGLVVGPITGFGSILVNGIEIDIASARISLDGVRAAPSALRLGMVVRVRGAIDTTAATGVGSSVDFNDELEGPVDAVDPGAGKIVVLGSIVLVDSRTVFDHTTLVTLSPPEVIEVSGFRDADGNVRATRVERKTGIGEFEIKGTITALNATARTFRLADLSVDFRNASVKGAPSGGLDDGLFVEVTTTHPLAGDVLFADKIEVKSQRLPGHTGEEAEIEGFVTDVVSSQEFVVNGMQTILLTDQTIFEGGGPANLIANTRLEAKGVFDTAGALIADKIEFDD